MDLFICHTILQARIAIKIIEINNIKNYDVFYFVNEDTIKDKYYFDKISELSNKSNYYLISKRFPLYFNEIKKTFKHTNYNTIHLASIDNPIVHLILTYTQFKKIITFDDGNANISYKSMYYIDNKPLTYKAISFTLGSRFSLTKVKNLTSLHYSIFENKKNISNNVKFIDLYKDEHIKAQRIIDKKDLQPECNVFLGSCYRHITDNEKGVKNLLKVRFSCLLNVICIPHPKEQDEIFTYDIDNKLMAEDFIFSLASKYNKINLYGIASTALIPFINSGWCNVYAIKSILIKPLYNEISDNLIESGAKLYNLAPD